MVIEKKIIENIMNTFKPFLRITHKIVINNCSLSSRLLIWKDSDTPDSIEVDLKNTYPNQNFCEYNSI